MGGLLLKMILMRRKWKWFSTYYFCDLAQITSLSLILFIYEMGKKKDLLCSVACNDKSTSSQCREGLEVIIYSISGHSMEANLEGRG